MIFLVYTILKWDKVIKLCLVLVHSGNLAHFHLELRASNWNRTVHEQNGENQTRTDRYMNAIERAKSPIFPLPAQHNDTQHKGLVYDTKP